MVNISKKVLKIRNWTFPLVCSFTWKLKFVSHVLPMILEQAFHPKQDNKNGQPWNSSSLWTFYNTLIKDARFYGNIHMATRSWIKKICFLVCINKLKLLLSITFSALFNSFKKSGNLAVESMSLLQSCCFSWKAIS